MNVETTALDTVAIADNVTVTNMPQALDEQQARTDLSAIQTLSRDNDTRTSQENEKLRDTQQKRQRDFLEKSWPLASVLLEDQNVALLTTLLSEVQLSIAPTYRKRCEQVAALQIGARNADGLWMTPARREERIGHLYSIFNKKGWTGEGLAKKLKDTLPSKLIAEDLKPSAEQVKRAEKHQARVADDERAPFVETPLFNSTTVEWKLALVSTDSSGLKVHKLTEIKGSVLDKEIEAHCKVRYGEIMEEVADATDAAA